MKGALIGYGLLLFAAMLFYTLLVMAGTGAAQGRGDLLALRGRPLGEPVAELGVARVHLEDLPALRIDDGQHPDVDQLQLARIDHLDGQQVVPG